MQNRLDVLSSSLNNRNPPLLRKQMCQEYDVSICPNVSKCLKYRHIQYLMSFDNTFYPLTWFLSPLTLQLANTGGSDLQPIQLSISYPLTKFQREAPEYIVYPIRIEVSSTFKALWQSSRFALWSACMTYKGLILPRPQSLPIMHCPAMISQPLIYIVCNCTALCPTKGLRRRQGLIDQAYSCLVL